MITDKDRHEVAQKLRWLPVDMYSTIDEWDMADCIERLCGDSE